ncbi:MAG: fumarylacetoacetate hydrolase family protein [Bacteroidales bacterium]|nr:fumarylacetoacetate hydrolase family protein [Tenuifilaceae bacterium]
MKIICINKNYPGLTTVPEVKMTDCPIFFFKPDTCLLRNNQPFFYPSFSTDIHCELEVVIKICRLGRNIAERFAHRYYNEIGLGINFSAQDIQQQCKQKGLPWEISEAFDGAAPISQFVKIPNNPNGINFWLEQNGEIIQKGNTNEMVYSFDKLIAYLSKYTTLKIGDLIYTGTPVATKPVAIGDRLKGYLNNELLLDFFVR